MADASSKVEAENLFWFTNDLVRTLYPPEGERSSAPTPQATSGRERLMVLRTTESPPVPEQTWVSRIPEPVFQGLMIAISLALVYGAWKLLRSWLFRREVDENYGVHTGIWYSKAQKAPLVARMLLRVAIVATAACVLGFLLMDYRRNSPDSAARSDLAALNTIAFNDPSLPAKLDAVLHRPGKVASLWAAITNRPIVDVVRRADYGRVRRMLTLHDLINRYRISDERAGSSFAIEGDLAIITVETQQPGVIASEASRLVYLHRLADGHLLGRAGRRPAASRPKQLMDTLRPGGEP